MQPITYNQKVKTFPKKQKSLSAFTLIELLIVISILGVLAVVLLILIKPGEKLAQSRDIGRISSVAQLGRAISRYFVMHEQTYPNPLTWNNDLMQTGEIKNFPSGIEYRLNSVTPCITNAEPEINPTFCYALDVVNDNGALIFSKLEATIEVEKCPIGDTYIVYSTADGRTGTICSDGDPTPWEPGTKNYLD